MLLHRIKFLLLALAIACPLTSSGQERFDQQIIGLWKLVSLQRTIDGKTVAPQVSDGMAFVEYFPNGTWTLKSPTNLAGGTYRWLDGERMEQTILESGLAIQIGMVSVKQISVTAERLEVITVQTAAEMDKFMPAQKPGTRRPSEVVITSVFSRSPPR